MSAHTPGPVEKVGHCGCYAIDRDEGKPFTIFFCATHAAAPALLEALATMVAAYGHYDTQAVSEARAAIRAAKGETAS